MASVQAGIKIGTATINEVLGIPLPEKTLTYCPVSNEDYLHMVNETADRFGLKLGTPKFGLAVNGNRMLGIVEVIGHDFMDKQVKLMMGLRNSYDKSMAAAICFGARVIICGNGSFMPFAGDDGIAGSAWHKHTSLVHDNFQTRLEVAMSKFEEMRSFQENFFNRLREIKITRDVAFAVACEGAFAKAINKTDIKAVCDEWIAQETEPITAEEEQENHHRLFFGTENTAWRLHNAFTEVLKERLEENPVAGAKALIQVNRLFHRKFVNQNDSLEFSNN